MRRTSLTTYRSDLSTLRHPSVGSCRTSIEPGEMRRSLLLHTRLLTGWRSCQTSGDPIEQALPFNKIPSPPAWPIIGHVPLLAKEEVRTGIEKFWREIHQEYGDIVRFKLPDRNMLLLFNPEYFKVMHRDEARIPHIEEFELFSYVREKILKAWINILTVKNVMMIIELSNNR